MGEPSVHDRIAELHEQLAAEYRRLSREQTTPAAGRRRVKQPKKQPNENVMRRVREKLNA